MLRGGRGAGLLGQGAGRPPGDSAAAPCTRRVELAAIPARVRRGAPATSPSGRGAELCVSRCPRGRWGCVARQSRLRGRDAWAPRRTGSRYGCRRGRRGRGARRSGARRGRRVRPRADPSVGSGRLMGTRVWDIRSFGTGQGRLLAPVGFGSVPVGAVRTRRHSVCPRDAHGQCGARPGAWAAGHCVRKGA